MRLLSAITLSSIHRVIELENLVRPPLNIRTGEIGYVSKVSVCFFKGIDVSRNLNVLLRVGR